MFFSTKQRSQERKLNLNEEDLILIDINWQLKEVKQNLKISDSKLRDHLLVETIFH